MDRLIERDFVEGKIYGVVVGEVTNNKDPENMGRVKLKLLLRDSKHETDWARVATLMAGKEKGSFFLPEVNDEVLVAFHEGSIKEPYVIGVLWNKKDKPPLNNSDGKNNIKKIKTRNGNEIIFSDESGKEGITIKTKKGSVIELDDDKGNIIIKESKGKSKITLDSKGNMDINSDNKINLKSKSTSIVLNGMSNSVDIKSSASLKIKAANLDIQSDGMLNIKSSGILTLKGSMVKIN